MQTTFCELRSKDVINVVDGKALGHIIDLVLDCRTGKTLGLIAPGENCKFRLFRPPDEIFIPWQNICKIGEDVILVELFQSGGCCTRGCSVNQLNAQTQTITPDDYHTESELHE